MDAGTVVVAALVASAVGALFYNVMPLYLGAAQDYRGFDNRSIGLLSAAFFLGYNVVTISAFFWIRRVSWSSVIAVATPVAALSLYAGTRVDTYGLLLATVTIAGGAFAVLYGIGTTILGDTSAPARWYGVKIAAEAFPGVILLLVLPSTAIAGWGFEGTVIGIIVAMVFLSPFLFWIPARGTKGSQSSDAAIQVSGIRVPQSPYIWGALLATLFFFSAASAVWAFVERIGARAGFDAAAIGVLLSVTLVFAVIGSLVAAIMGGRFGNVRLFTTGSIGLILALVILDTPGSFAEYAVATCANTFAIGFMLPIAVTEIAELDRDGRYIVLSVPALGLGAMAGPGIAGLMTQSGGFRPLIVLSIAMVAASALLIGISAVRARRSIVQHV